MVENEVNKDLVPVAEVVRTPEQWIAEAVTKVSQPDKVEIALTELKTRYGSLTIKDDNDRPGYLAVVEGAKIAKKFRTGIEAKRKEILAFPKKFTDSVNAEAKRITAEVEAIEIDLNKKQKDYEDKEAAAKDKLLGERKQQFLDAGFKFDGMAYVCGVHVVPADKLPDMEADKVDYYITEAKKIVEAEKQREANLLAVQQANTEEGKKLAEERVALDKQKAEMEVMLQQMAQMKADLEAKLNPPAPTPVEKLEDVGPGTVVSIEEKSGTLERPANNIDANSGTFGGGGFNNQPAQEETPVQDNVPGSENFDLDEHIANSGRTAEYIDGYEHCREAVLAIFNDATPKKRGDFINEIKALKP